VKDHAVAVFYVLTTRTPSRSSHTTSMDSTGRGLVHIKLLSDLPVGSTSWQESRRAARYVSKYVTKAMDRKEGTGLHRYDVAEGFQPRGRRLRGVSPEDVIGQARQVMGGQPSYAWSSSETMGWQGPPALWLSWDR
jgi:hypothetical protein